MEQQPEGRHRTSSTPPYPMIGGNGPLSYANNSSFQRRATEVAWAKINEVIMEKLDFAAFPPSKAKTVMVVDLGCSVGPNTFFAAQSIIDSARRTYLLQGFPPSELPQFQVFFNDQAGNDFNTLFLSLPPDRSYFAAGVPGSFHGRLFPQSSLHFVHSTYSLNWLSKLPEELLNRNSPAFNKGRVHYVSAPPRVRDSFSAQFEIDMAAFFSARSKEMLTGGLMVVVMPGIADGVPHSHMISGVMFDILGRCLMDMAGEGIINEEEVDSFNLPVYFPTPEEMAELIGRDGGFSIEKLELMEPGQKQGRPLPTQALTQSVRAVMGGVISKHFGEGIIDQLFVRFFHKTEEHAELVASAAATTSQLLIVLKRKPQ